MPLNPEQVMGVVRQGYSIVCATCLKFWRGRDAGLHGCSVKCTGPIGGDNFPEYEGELPDLMRFCFVCGRGSFYALQVADRERRVGVCKAHLTHLHELVPKGGGVPDGSIYASRGGSMVRVERIIHKPKTLIAAMKEQQDAWDEEDKHIAEKLGIDPDKGLAS